MTRARRHLTLAATPLVALGVLAWAGRATPTPWIINETASLPPGLYRHAPGAPLARGTVMTVVPPPASRAYLRSLGLPDQNRLLKRIGALAGDQVCADGMSVTVGGRRLAVHAADRTGRPLPRWTGCRVLRADELFVLGDTPSSFDSRYFGPVPMTSVAGPYRELLLW